MWHLLNNILGSEYYIPIIRPRPHQPSVSWLLGKATAQLPDCQHVSGCLCSLAFFIQLYTYVSLSLSYFICLFHKIYELSFTPVETFVCLIYGRRHAACSPFDFGGALQYSSDDGPSPTKSERKMPSGFIHMSLWHSFTWAVWFWNMYNCSIIHLLNKMKTGIIQ